MRQVGFFNFFTIFFIKKHKKTPCRFTDRVLIARNNILLALSFEEVTEVDHVVFGFESGGCGIFFAGGLEVFFVELFSDSLDGKTDAAFVVVDFDHAGFDFIVDVEDILDLST